MIKVGIVGGTGYTGVELLRLLAQHPQAQLQAITRTATYGSWFNFYLCRFDAKNIVLPTGPTPAGLGYNVASARCR